MYSCVFKSATWRAESFYFNILSSCSVSRPGSPPSASVAPPLCRVCQRSATILKQPQLKYEASVREVTLNAHFMGNWTEFITETAAERLPRVKITVSNAAVYIHAKFPKKGCLCLGKYILLRIMCAIVQHVLNSWRMVFVSLSLNGDYIVGVIQLMTVQLV